LKVAFVFRFSLFQIVGCLRTKSIDG